MIHIKNVVAAFVALKTTVEMPTTKARMVCNISSFSADFKPSLALLFVGCFPINALYRPIAVTTGRYSAIFSSIGHT